ncbi:MAG: tRNA (N(6)-L-threonylcarbamoyladenosine(37)-C(2))-methylthiotransferase MtaB [Candidatus Marinimicrobia bacterium]|nr:tRNA (N(6)-L-threonylcarbamoyladenosine(37)-C(2))-methylthiotransferase MtaB [Candidatus Neomarinimicrobiota bacterium]|tara:strand:+ start:2138 stop:3436 length:1299 start_codon:yes stop_codon:yes gene_type:complete
MSTEFRKVAFHTLGCKLNFTESSMLKSRMIEKGYQSVKFNDKADVYVINTCSVTDNADKECRKIIRRVKRNNPNSVIAVIGCYAQLKPEIISQIPGVNLVLGAEEKFNLLDHINSIHADSPVSVLNGDIKHVREFFPSYSRGERTRAFMKVQDGCDYKCTFCTIPLARGRSRSQSISNTMKVAQKISESNYKEIVLTGVNIGDFGKNTNESFFGLVKELEQLNDIERIRISSIEPNLLTDEIIEFVANSDKFMPHFHIPLQSGSDKVLKLMKRRYRTELYTNRIQKIKSMVPDCGIGVDVIVGFPGETQSDFLDTYHYIADLDVSYLHVFTYSERADTAAVSMDYSVDKIERANRSKMLHILSNKKKELFYTKHANSIHDVLFESFLNGQNIGWTKNYIRVNIQSDKNLENKIERVHLSNFKGQLMNGELII